MKLVQGLAPNLDLSLAPHHPEPLDMAGDNSVKLLGYLMPPGSGKTTMIEGLIQWRVVCSPSNILLVGQKDDSAELWAETRLHPSFKKSEAMRPFMPENRHQTRKSTIIFPLGIYLDICGPSLSNLQEKSMPWVFIDEAWAMDDKPGRIKEASARMHSKWNRKMFLVGQAGRTHLRPDEDDSLCELYQYWKDSSQRTFHFECPECKSAQPYKWRFLRYEKTVMESGDIDWEETSKTIRYTCAHPDCGAEFPDTPKVRRMLASSLVGREQYRVQNPHHRKGVEFFHINVLGLWRTEWLEAVMDFEDAIAALKKGDKSLLEVFTQKKLCEFWTPSAHDERHELKLGGYKIAEFANGEPIPGEITRAIGVDVQQTGLWFTIFAFAPDGEMRLLDCGESLTFDEIEEKRKTYKVQKYAVLVDSQYRQDYVFGKCAEFGWTAFKGTQKDEFTIHMEDGTSIKAPYSKVEPAFTGGGKRTNYINFASNKIKDVIHEMRAGRIGNLMVPDDVDPRYRKHLDAEVKMTIPFGTEKRMKEVWVRVSKRDNHMLDCTYACVGFGMVKGLVRINAEIATE